MLISKAGREYQRTVKGLLIERFGLRFSCTPPYDIHFDVWMPDRRKRDLDNLLKAMLDALEASGLLVDDSLVYKLSMNRRGVLKGGKVVAIIKSMEDIYEAEDL